MAHRHSKAKKLYSQAYMIGGTAQGMYEEGLEGARERGPA